jgi:hypothetical protein
VRPRPPYVLSFDDRELVDQVELPACCDEPEQTRDGEPVAADARLPAYPARLDK